MSFTTQKVTSGNAYDIDSSTLTYQCTPGTLSAITVVPNSFVINEQTSYTITLTVEHQLVSGSFIEIIFPADLSISIAHTCSSVGHLCDVNGVDNITVTLQSTLAPASSIAIIVENVTNANQAK